MAISTGVLRLRGRVGDLVYRHCKNGRIVVAKRPAKRYIPPTQHNEDFAKAAKMSKLVTNQIESFTVGMDRQKIWSQFMSTMLRVVKSAQANCREPGEDDLKPIHGFEFNKTSRLISTLRSKVEIQLDRRNACVSVDAKDFSPSSGFYPPKGTDQVRLFAMVLDPGVKWVKCNKDVGFGPMMPFPSIQKINFHFKLKTSLQSKTPWIILVGVQFFSRGEMIERNTSLAIVAVDCTPDRVWERIFKKRVKTSVPRILGNG